MLRAVIEAAEQRKSLSLRQLWDLALTHSPQSDQSRWQVPPDLPPMHQNSRVNIRGVSGPRDTRPRRCARKIFDGRGLYLLVMPNGSRYWRYNYRFAGKLKTLALGVHPDVSLEKARARHQVARTMLSDGVDPLLASGRWASASLRPTECWSSRSAGLGGPVRILAVDTQQRDERAFPAQWAKG
jgi:hypothetical protein